MRKKIELPAKTCAACHRPFVWTKKWARVWTDVHYCSDQCRRQAEQSPIEMRCEPVFDRAFGAAFRPR
jgi:hypothetical protein